MSLTITPLKNIPLIRQGDNLADILVDSILNSTIQLENNDILVIAQKIVSKSEGRMVNLATVTPSEKAIELAQKTEKDARVVQLMLQESNEIVRTRIGAIIVEHKLGFVCANAGIDHSNVAGDGSENEEYVLLLPEDPDASAKALRDQIKQKTDINVGVMIIDSHGRAWRNGTVGVCIGLSGIPAMIDERGWKDLFGFTLKITIVGVADELAAAASLMMGQASEGIPAVHVRGFPYPLGEGSLKELIRPKQQDMFR
ncbi:MAG: coenzyme F420-0:L-glutamate ligase [Anaerolineales bacterium]|jgi:coenzyme F420-0:L-glutamate ligase/coenzyme F420-1:gamma-L-glutamate ligase|uniref:coenzyme F420-0:L-glutamate ligase n=1 Tax=Candidatus Villigracilis affinis TaxID=3140682 RepID=UPI001D792732|nr:coenzyme F420-0:L-glutamate ligase [Anaerolineales bacterium]MBK9604346.1 coenzyme F420-0:L-glutamate ligase [Anaerolineales bacterium]MBL0344746.1 coenzyme F420-0:L-glutamate ligase [Anaerolineales bacterium]